MHRIITLSSVGTSLLNNVAKTISPSEERLLRSSANASENDLSETERQAILALASKARELLVGAGPDEAAALSAELNGIIKYYGDRLLDPQRHASDRHYLISTDTFQARLTGGLVQQWLQKVGFRDVCLFPVPSLTVLNQESFQRGIAHLIRWCSEVFGDERQGADNPEKTRVVFNLVGGFKSLQGYLNTLGMLYAHEIIYVFEGPDAGLIRIPGLPMRLAEQEAMRAHARDLLLLERRGYLARGKGASIPGAFLETDAKGDMTFSVWGQMIWETSKKAILAESDLLDFPYLVYEDSFRREFRDLDPQDRVQVLHTLAYISVLLEEGREQELSEGELQFKPLRGKRGPDVYYLRISDDKRMSCLREQSRQRRPLLRLRHVGYKEAVLQREGVKK